MSIQVLLDRLDKVKSTGENKYSSCCPAHEDSSPSLAIKELPDGRILIHCFASCETLSILNAVGLTMAELFPEGSSGDYRPLFMARQDKKGKDHHRAILTIASSMRSRGEMLSTKELAEEKQAFMALR